VDDLAEPTPDTSSLIELDADLAEPTPDTSSLIELDADLAEPTPDTSSLIELDADLVEESLTDEVATDAPQTDVVEPEHAIAAPVAAPIEPSAPPGPVPVHIPRIVFVDVVSANDDEVVVKLADGRAGVIARRDAVAGVTMSPGSTIEAAVLARTDSAGRVLLSQKWAHQQRAWEQIDAAREQGVPMMGIPRRSVKGGVVVELAGLRAFMPASHTDRPAGSDLAVMFDQELEVAVIEVDRAADRIVVSRRDLVRRQRRASEKAAFGSLKVGSTVTGKVATILDFGVQVDLGEGVRGLIHRSELSWSRVTDMSAIVTIGDDVTVTVLEVNRSKRRVGLSLRQTQSDPLATVNVGDIDRAVITSVVEYGAFARMIESGAEGLIHQSELTEQFGLRPDQIVMTGEEVAVKVLDIDTKKRRLGLSIRQAVLS